jgi:hypothetical protein
MPPSKLPTGLALSYCRSESRGSWGLPLELREVFILGHDDRGLRGSHLPNIAIRGSFQAKVDDMLSFVAEEL